MFTILDSLCLRLPIHVGSRLTASTATSSRSRVCGAFCLSISQSATLFIFLPGKVIKFIKQVVEFSNVSLTFHDVFQPFNFALHELCILVGFGKSFLKR